jgi:hypothetical protein
MPTAAQAISCFNLCQQLTNFFIPINIVRLDRRTGQIFILAGEETEILININGNWDYA